MTPADHLQIVAWIEDASGHFPDTVFITQETGTFGLGNRPGRFDFNSGPMWPYGRRITTFPVWAHRKLPLSFPQVIFQNVEGYNQRCYTQCVAAGSTPALCQTQCLNPSDCESLVNDAFATCGDNNLSHSFEESSH